MVRRDVFWKSIKLQVFGRFNNGSYTINSTFLYESAFIAFRIICTSLRAVRKINMTCSETVAYTEGFACTIDRRKTMKTKSVEYSL